MPDARWPPPRESFTRSGGPRRPRPLRPGRCMSASLALPDALAAPPPVPRGLTEAEARRRLVAAGANELSRSMRVGLVRHVASQLASPLMLILLAASGVAAWTRNTVDALIIVGAVALSVL